MYPLIGGRGRSRPVEGEEVIEACHSIYNYSVFLRKPGFDVMAA